MPESSPGPTDDGALLDVHPRKGLRVITIFLALFLTCQAIGTNDRNPGWLLSATTALTWLWYRRSRLAVVNGKVIYRNGFLPAREHSLEEIRSARSEQVKSTFNKPRQVVVRFRRRDTRPLWISEGVFDLEDLERFKEIIARNCGKQSGDPVPTSRIGK